MDYSPATVSRPPSFSVRLNSMQSPKTFFAALGALIPFMVFQPAWCAEKPDPCGPRIAVLKKVKNKVINLGGTWSLFQSHQALRPKGSHALQLDKKIQQVLVLLVYLCETLDGVPLNDLATYVTQHLKNQTPEEFRKKHIILGKTPEELDIWLEFAKLSLKNENRKLDSKILLASIAKVQPLLEQYKTLAMELQASPDQKHAREVDRLSQAIERLIHSDGYLSQALRETSQVPYWDLDENYGGS